ncbi:MAG: OmpA family protein [Atribacterota bacterium]|nr:OmpA family protein [Atribacterota bacterium]
MKAKYLLPAVFASLLVGCGTVSQVNKEGNTADPVFPELKKLTMPDGTWPNVDNLRHVQDGVNRDQLYDLLGRPHFKEGLGTREWDYLFHFDTPEGKKICQFKVLFDTDKIARNFYWLPEDCMEAPKELVEFVKPEPIAFSLNGDVAFGFDSAELTAYGRNEVSKIAKNIKQQGVLEAVVVAGHTDRIGSDAYNNYLSQRRADAVRQILISEGIDHQVLQAVGYGKSEPIVQCENASRADLISCLAPNRRVEITTQGSTERE